MNENYEKIRENILMWKSHLNEEWESHIVDDTIGNMINFVAELNLIYVGFGGSCISFINENDNNIIYKVCLKKDNTVMANSKKFIRHMNILIKNKINALPALDVVYEDDYFFIYTQNFCNPISTINANNLCMMLKSIKQMIVSKYRLPDIFFRNFGIYKNELIIYDYHDYSDFYTEDYLYIVHIAHLFSLYYKKNYVFDNLFTRIKNIINNNYCEEYFDNKDISKLLKSLYQWDMDIAVEYFDKLIESVSNDIKLDIINYQYIHIDKNGILNLDNHTLEKFNLVNIILDKMPEKFTVIDCGCSLGGIGIKIGQLYSNASITLNNITKSEIETAENITNHLCMNNVIYNTENLITHENSYDCTLYFAILHHILKNLTFDEVMRKVYNMTNIYAIIELPFGKDALLRKIMESSLMDYKSSYYYLQNIELFLGEVGKYFEVISYKEINYGSTDLERYGFVLKKIIQ